MIRIKPYKENLSEQWNHFVELSKNGTFLFNRSYMDYHSDRFQDSSLMIFEEDKLIAIFPASIHENNVVKSHGGLTYGGLIIDQSMKTPNYLKIFEQCLNYYKEKKVGKLIYKPVPKIYHKICADEDLYALFRFNASLIRCDVSSSVNLQEEFKFSSRRKRGMKKALNNSLSFMQSNDLSSFYAILVEVLKNSHGVMPVHNLNELELLCSRFPENISLYVCKKEKQVLAGSLIYINNGVAHAQYICANNLGKELGALDLLFIKLIEEEFQGYKYFDFGISTEENGKYLNEGLINQKEEFGARSIVYNTYQISL